MAAVPAARLADHVWLEHLARSGGQLEYVLPGVVVRAIPVAVLSGSGASSIPWDELLPEDRSGFIHSDSRSAMAGTRLLTVWHRHPSSPPYELLILLLAGSLALIAAHAARRRLAHAVSA